MEASMTSWLLAFLIALAGASVATRAVMAIGISDMPDEARKLHTKVTPTSGGLGILAGVAAGLTYFAWAEQLFLTASFLACVALAVFGAMLGLVDDIKALGSKRKLAVMLIGSALFVGSGTRIDAFEVTPDLVFAMGPILGGIGTVFWLLVIVNTVNFMDGANGMAMGCAGLGLLGLSALIGFNNIPDRDMVSFVVLGWVTCAACLGFLVWNAGLGRIFAGDSGALFVGLLSGSLGAIAVVSGVNPFSVTLCFLPMLVDVILTVAMRLRRKQNVLQAHSDHAYQGAIRAGASHLYTSGRYWLQTFFCVIMALAAQARGGWWPLGLFIGFTLILSTLYFLTFAVIAKPKKQDEEQD
jgi:UDP-GlcNAc:undecaprenyl-phosphate/decaprenyl-phosphate GlcNAc-1-phosphate transferase